MPIVDGQPVPREPAVRVEPSLAVELEWVMDSAMHLDWQAEHPDLDELYRRHPDLAGELVGLWGPDRATSCGGFLELTVLAQVAGQLFSTDADALFAALPDAMVHAAADLTRLPLYSESDEDRTAVWSRLSALRRSKSRRQRYVEVARRTWEAAADAWEQRGRTSVERALARRRQMLQAGSDWPDLADNSYFSNHLPATVAAVGPGAEVAVVPCYFAHKGLFVDMGRRVLISLRSEPMASAARTRTDALARQLRTVADPTRLAILDMLRRSPSTVTELASRLSLAQPTVSNHVKLLRDGGLVSDVRRGRHRQLEIRPEALERLFGGLTELLDAPASPQP